MAVRVGTDGITASGAYEKSLSFARNIKDMAVRHLDRMTTGVERLDDLVVLYTALNSSKVALVRFKAISGVTAHGRRQTGDSNYNVVAELNATLVALDAVIDRIVLEMPADGRGFWLFVKPNIAKTQLDRPLATGTAALQADLTALVATIV